MHLYSRSVRKHVGPIRLAWLMIRPALAALLIGGLYALRYWSLAVVIPISAIVYGVLVLATKTLSPDDWQLLRKVILPGADSQR